ncbi:MAG: hypothetical protein Q4G22_09305 [Paracoccus sp. (in: a-proteobacteria)]|uniref:MotE family protein n=1 Tax=Paracoccus sp. TaxID=267 RepID=UPI0026E0CC90|nr:hypothetical protein [Paracoccus sp. (in: a-proteobacteria)]MDO5632023.1 hypothetical protein [Paracoccus sp. (in: a-proteobacteria)]
MHKRILPVLGLTLLLPVAVVAARHVDLPRSLFAFAAAPSTLMEGCLDVPEAVAMAGELRDRALRIQTYTEALEAKKAELALAEQTLRTRLSELRAVQTSSHSRRSQASAAVQDDINRLVAVYDVMKPTDAAQVLTSLPPDFAAEILMRLTPENGARIIAAVEPGQAAILTTHMGARSARKP